MADVFLSYASVDLELAQRVAQALESSGYSVWWDRHLLSGERFQQSIQAELSAAKAVVVVWTPSSVQSEWVYSEARRGNARGALVQLRADEVDIDDLPAPFDALHCPFVGDTDALLRAVAAQVARPGVEPADSAASRTLDAGHARERKVVTVLIAEVEATTALDPEELEVRVAPYLTRGRAVIEGFAGTMHPVTGSSLLAVFGAPVAHEDDPERAVRSALGLLAMMTELNAQADVSFSLRVGVATGAAVVSGLNVTGEVVSMARRLQSSATSDAALASHDTYLATRASVEYRPVDGGTGSGSDTASVWQVVASRGSVGEDLSDRLHPMIGREDELAQLQRSLLRAVRESAVHLVTIVAEPGLGKSRLVQAFFDWIDERDELVTWRQGRCPAYGEAVAFAALAEIVKAQTGILDSDPADIAQEKLGAAVNALVEGTELFDQASWLEASLARLVGLPADEASQEELFTAWRRFVEAMATTGPLVLIVEDLHWADRALLDFLSHLLEWVDQFPLLIIATARPELYDKAPTWAAGHRNAATLSLSPLTDAETALLIASRLGAESLPPDLHAALLSRAAGNPLYAREYLAMVAGQSGLGDASDRPLADTLPTSVQAVIAARLDTLPPTMKRLLQAASVIGSTFWTGAAASLVHAETDVVDRSLHELARKDFLRRSRQSRVAGQAEYTFAHALIADVAQAGLPRGERASMHEAAGLWHAALNQDPDHEIDSALVAHHYTTSYLITLESGGDDASIARRREMAATWHSHAAASYNGVDVHAMLRHAEAAVEFTPEVHSALAERLVALADAQRSLGRTAAAYETAQRAQRVADGRGDALTAGSAQVRCSELLYSLGRPVEALATLVSGIASMEQLGDSRDLANAYLSMSNGMLVEGQLAEAARVAERATDMVERLENPDVRLRVRALLIRGEARLDTGDVGRGEDDLRSALELAVTHRVPRHASGISYVLACHYSNQLDQAEASRFAAASLDVAEERGSISQIPGYASLLADLHLEGGRLEEALATCERASAMAHGVENARSWASLHLTWARVLATAGRVEDAQRLLAPMLEVRNSSELDVKAYTLLSAAELPNDSSSSYADELSDLLTDHDVREVMADTLPRVVRLLASPTTRALMGALIDDAPRWMPAHEARLLTARARVAEAGGERAPALALYEEVERVWAAAGMRLEQAHALLGAARCQEVPGASSREPAARARDILATMGAGPLLAEAETEAQALTTEIP